ncbi:MAG TPA: hypothetical protein EYN06_06410 [Myxococcales bacterium]|nr:hypothetical protein [Myxococcales bacterium]
MNQQTQNPMQVAREFYNSYPDEFDALCVFTTFPDAGSEKSVAWALSVKQDVTGIGMPKQDWSFSWGAKEGALHSFINMQYVGKYGSNLNHTKHWIHAVMAQEFAHRWGTFIKYADKDGLASSALLGRDKAHWANGVQAFGSVMDGHEWYDLENGTFNLKAKNYRFSELDQYLMGLRPSSEVPDFFLINKMTYKGKSVPSHVELPKGVTVTGEREDITMKQILLAQGERKPKYDDAQKDFRVAIILLTRPGEKPAQVQSYVEKLEEFRMTFEQKVSEFSDGNMKLCTQVSSPCDSAGVVLNDYTVSEENGNGNGTIDPGELVRIDFSVRSTGVGTAISVEVEVEDPTPDTMSIQVPLVQVGDIEEGAVKQAPNPILIQIPPMVVCGAAARVPIRLRTDGRSFYGEIHFEIGVDGIIFDGLEAPDDWQIDPYATDTAKAGNWEIGEPKGVDANYIGINLITQLSEDHTPDGVNVLVTGREAGHIGDHDVDGGVTTAMSPSYDISGARDPLLTWYSWHFAYDFNSPTGVVPVENDALVTELSGDGGKSWVVIKSDTSNEQKWVRNEVRLAEYVDLDGMIRLRFTMSDDPASSLSEAMIDDIRIWDESLVCRPDLRKPEVPDTPDPPDTPQDDGGGSDDGSSEIEVTDGGSSGGCTQSSGPTHSALPVFLLAIACLLMRRRRRV